MAGGALVNALAFSGTNFIFGQLGNHGKGKIKRYNLAVERLSKARDDSQKSKVSRVLPASEATARRLCRPRGESLSAFWGLSLLDRAPFTCYMLL